MTPTFHLHDVFGVSKALIKRNYSETSAADDSPNVKVLLARRTQNYTLAETRELLGFMVQSHHECVIENPEDYTALELHTAVAIVARYDEAVNVLANMDAASDVTLESFIAATTGFTSLADMISISSGESGSIWIPCSRLPRSGGE